MNLRKKYKGVPAGEIKAFLEEKYLQYNTPGFIEKDPVSIPHRFSDTKDREISSFLTATIAWGRRDLILRSAEELMNIMWNSPYEFMLHASDDEFLNATGFVHRTFNGSDCLYFLKSLRNIYSQYGSIEDVIAEGMEKRKTLIGGLSWFREKFFILPHSIHAEKHFADITRGAAGKRLFMFLRWMIRSDNRGVDFGIWKRIKPSELYIPLDFHAGNTARKLGLLKRKQNDFKAVEELTAVLREFDPEDPVKYDFALFGLGIYEKF